MWWDTHGKGIGGQVDIDAEFERARIDQFRFDRWPHAIGHVGATAAVIAIAWTSADHGRLLWFGIAHHLATWVLAVSFFLPLRSKQIRRLPLATYLGVIVGNATLSSALLFDLNAATELTFVLAVAVVLFAGAAGSFVTLGQHPTLLRVGLTSLLMPFVITALALGHVAHAVGTLFFLSLIHI